MQGSSSTARRVELDVPVQLHIDGHPEDIKASIHSVYSGLVELSSPVHLKHDQKLDMVCEGRTIPSLVAFCRRQVSGNYDLAIKVTRDANTRAEARIPADISTKLYIVGSPAAIAIKVIDFSPSGLGIELPTPIPVGSRVSVALGQRAARGEVSHCTLKLRNYRAGIWLEELTELHHRNSHKWTDLNSGSSNLPAVAAFVRSVEERQAKSEAIVFSLARSIAKH